MEAMASSSPSPSPSSWLLTGAWKQKERARKFGFYSTAEEVTEGIDGSSLTAIVTGTLGSSSLLSPF
jgi:hypothetical protein